MWGPFPDRWLPGFYELHTMHPEVNILKTSYKTNKLRWDTLWEWRRAHRPDTMRQWRIEKHIDRIKYIKSGRSNPCYRSTSLSEEEMQTATDPEIKAIVAEIERLRARDLARKQAMQSRMD